MKKIFCKKMNLIITPIFILAIVVWLLTFQLVDSTYSVNCNAKTNLEQIEVIPGGDCIGVRLTSKGVLVVGFTDTIKEEVVTRGAAQNNGIEIGDLIQKFNNEEVTSSKDLIGKIKNLKTDVINLTILRNTTKLQKEIKLTKEQGAEYKLGLWVRDSTAGVGTLTFYHEGTKKFGALGHPVTDSDTNKCFQIKDGDLLESSIISIKKGEKGAPGELRGIFSNEKNIIGSIYKNTQCGIFGEYKKDSVDMTQKQTKKIATREEIKTGKATLITTIDENGPKEYEIEIVKLFNQDEPGAKSMLIKVTDEELLQKTGGIVQGMSGSPIIQDNKIVGAVTHVLINKPDVGYGIYIDWMLKEAGIID